MDIRLSNAELSVMQILWREGESRASEIAGIAQGESGWEKNTTYTLINRLIKKGAVKRTDPGFVCTPLIGQDAVRKIEAKAFLEKMFDGSLKVFAKAFLEDHQLSEKELEELRQIINGKDK